MPMPQVEGKLLPHSIEAEQGVLGCILLAPEASIGLAIERLKRGAEVFYDLRHQALFDVLREMVEKKALIDAITVRQYLRDRNQLEALGGMPYIAGLMNCVPSAASLEYYIDIVNEKFLLRKVIQTCTTTVANIYDHQGDVAELLDQTEKSILEISRERIVSKKRTTKEQVHGAMDRIIALFESKDGMMGLNTGFKSLNQVTAGLKSEMMVIAARPSCGKAQPLSAMVLTPRGFCPMGKLKVGALVIGADGKPHAVTGVFPQGVKPVYRVTFTDGSSTRCCAEHLWMTQSRNERRRGDAGSVKSTDEIKNTLHIEGDRNNHMAPLVRVVEFEDWGTPLPLDPWLLGALLGDGSLTKTSITFDKPERDVQQKLISLLPQEDTASTDGMCVRIKRRKRNRALPSSTKQALIGLGIMGLHSISKYIPEMYLRSTPHNRMELLRGLLDTDGYVLGKRGSCVEYTSSSPEMAEQVSFLARSLGAICSNAAPRIPTYTYKGEKLKGQTNYRMNIWFPDRDVVPVSSEKHLAKWGTSKRFMNRLFTSVEPDGEEQCQCIMIDSEDHLYVTDDFIITHNTSLVMNIAEFVAVESREPVGVFSLEMTADSLFMRMILSRSRVSRNKVKDKSITEQDMARMTVATGKISHAPLHIEDRSGMTIAQIRARAREMREEHGIKLFVIDYLQLIGGSPEKAASSRQQEIAEVSIGIKAITKDLDVPVIVCAQLNRESDRDKGRKPRMSDLRESGQIEQDADFIGILYNPKKDDPEAERTQEVQTNMIIAKQRDGATGEVPFWFQKHITRFSAMDRIWNPNTKQFEDRSADSCSEP